MQSMKTIRRVPRDKSKTTRTTKRHDFRECRSEVRWLITWQASTDTLAKMQRVKEEIAFDVELINDLTNDSTYLWLTSEQMGFPLR